MPSVTAADSHKLRKILAESVMAIAGIFANLYIMLPLYMPDAPLSSAMPLVMGTILPFNLVRGAVVSVITMLIYKKISPILKFSGGNKNNENVERI